MPKRIYKRIDYTMVSLEKYYQDFLKIGRTTSNNEIILKYITEKAITDGYKIERENMTIMLVGKDPWTIKDKVKEIFRQDKKTDDKD